MRSIIILLAVTLFWLGCKMENGCNGSPSDRIKKLAEDVEANPGDKTALRKLEKLSTDSDFWTRSAAYGYLGNLAFRNIGGCQAELIPYFRVAMMDQDYGIKQAGIQAVYEIGSPAVESNLPAILNIIQKGNEDDITWQSIRAIGELKNAEQSRYVLPILIKIADKPPPDGTPDEGPQSRYFALDSIEEISKQNHLIVIPELEKLATENRYPYKERVAKTISDLGAQTNSVRQP